MNLRKPNRQIPEMNTEVKCASESSHISKILSQYKKSGKK